MSIEIHYKDRPMHIYMPGRTRHGKSTLMFWMVMADIENEQGVTVIDAKGDLIDNLLKAIPIKYRDKTVYLDLETPIPFDFMSVQGETPVQRDRSKEQLVSDLKFLIGRGG